MTVPETYLSTTSNRSV